MRKTQRRSLYSRRRRLRGKGLGKAICAGALIAAISMVPPAAATEPTFYELAHKYATEGGWDNSHNLAKYITDMNWATPENLYPEECTIPAGIDAEKVLEPYLLSPGDRVDIVVTNPDNYDGIPTIRRGTIVSIGKGKAEKIVEDDIETVTVDGYRIKEHKEDDDEIAVFFPSDYVKLTPVPKGGRRRQRRKTLRRK